MPRIRLQRNVQFLYEEHLARIELKALGCGECVRDENNPWEFEAAIPVDDSRIAERSAYVGSVDGKRTVYEQLLLPAYQGGSYNRTRSVNQYLTHWIYPYRGKFHPQMVRALFNILGVGRGSQVLEPFLGSGTAALEASLLGASCIGIDRSPVCVLVAQVKTRAWRVISELKPRVEELLGDPLLTPDDVLPVEEANKEIAAFLQVAQLVTSSDVARRGRDAIPAFRKNLLTMLESVEAMAKAVTDFGLELGDVEPKQGDARDLTAADVEDDSIDAIVTSPPYSIALDYVKNDEHALQELQENLTGLRAEMIGVRGKGKERLGLYNEDMQKVFNEVGRVLKPGGAAAFVIGDATVGGSEVTTTDEMIEWGISSGLKAVRNIPKIVFGLYNVMQDERIIIFRKE